MQKIGAKGEGRRKPAILRIQGNRDLTIGVSGWGQGVGDSPWAQALQPAEGMHLGSQEWFQHLVMELLLHSDPGPELLEGKLTAMAWEFTGLEGKDGIMERRRAGGQGGETKEAHAWHRQTDRLQGEGVAWEGLSRMPDVSQMGGASRSQTWAGEELQAAGGQGQVWGPGSRP